MARIWQTGFEHFDLSVFSSYGSAGTASVSISNTAGYLTSEITNPGAAIVAGYGGADDCWAQISLPAALRSAEMYLRFMARGNSLAAMIFYIKDDLGNELLRFNGDGRVWILGADQGVVISDTAGSWRRWEIYLKVHDTDGLCEIKLNGTTQFSFGPGDTKGAGDVITTFRWDSDGGNGAYWYLDDIAINDTVDDGRGNDTWCGPGKIFGFRPCSFPGVEAWTPVPAAGAYPDGNWARIDEETPDDATTYVHSDTPGTIDYHVTENIPSAAAIIRAGCVSHSLRMRLATAGAGEVQPYSARDGHFQTGDAIALSTAWYHYQQMVPTEPNGGEWTKALFDDTQFGYRDAS